MRFPSVNDIASWYKKKKGVTPLVSQHEDMKLVQRIHGRSRPRWQQILHIGRVLSPWERRLWYVSIMLLCAGVIWLGLVIVGRYRVQAPASGGKYTEAVVGSPQLINPIFASVNDVDQDITQLVYSGLLRYDEAQRLVPDLAAHYDVSDDKKTYTFSLKKNVVWHDGEPFTARDVAFTIDAIQNPAVASPLLVSFQGVTVNAVDDYTITFTLKEPFAPFLSALTVGILPDHAWADIQPERIRLAQLNIQPVGTGPFQFQKLVKDDVGNLYRFELKRFPQYYNTAPYLDEFAFQFYNGYDGDTGAITALRQQDVDGLSFVPYNVRDKILRKHISLHTLQLPQYTALFFNTDAAPLAQDKDARLALATALDKNRILRDSSNHDGQAIDSPVLSGFPGYQPESDTLPYSVANANKLLDKNWPRVSAADYRVLRQAELEKQWDATAASGTPAVMSSSSLVTLATSTNPSAGKTEAIREQLDEELGSAQTFYRKDKDGDVVGLSLVTADTEEYKKVAEGVAGFWQDVGIKVNITYVAPKDFSREALRGRNYDVLLYGVIIGSDPDQYPFWHSSQVDFPGLNLSRYVNRTVDAILEKARVTANPDELETLYQKFQENILKDRPAIFLYTPTYTYATTDKIQGIAVSRIFHPADRFANVAGWYVKTKGLWNFKKSS